MKTFRTKQSFRNYLLSGKKVLCGSLVFFIYKGELSCIVQNRVAISIRDLDSFVEYWFNYGHTVVKIKNKKHYCILHKQGKIAYPYISPRGTI